MLRAIACVCCVVLVGLAPGPVSAHGLGIEVRLRSSTLHLEAYFDDNSPVANATLLLLDRANAVLVEAKTDGNGVFTLPAPQPGTYRVEIRGEDGHFAKTTLTIPDQAAQDNTLVSEGQTRAQRTGARKWGLAVFGLAVIAAGTMVLQWFLKKPVPSP